jgi:uncharacterized protein with LGFP repeats
MNNRILAILVAAAALPVFAQTPSTPRVDQRQANQEARIQQGAQTGELTPKETAKLEKGQAKVQKMENKAVADGKVTPKEQAKLEKAQNKQSRKIAKKKHNQKKVS